MKKEKKAEKKTIKQKTKNGILSYTVCRKYERNLSGVAYGFENISPFLPLSSLVLSNEVECSSPETHFRKMNERISETNN